MEKTFQKSLDREDTMLQFFIPSPAHARDAAAYRTEVLACGGDFDGSAGLGEFERYTDWLERLRILADKRAEKFGWYRTPVRLAYDGDRLIAILNVRLSEDPFVRTYAGHIGYHVRPSCRKQGYGRACAMEAVRLCQEHGILRPVICTSPENLASRKTAESAGFVFSGYETTDSGITVARYVKT